MIKRMSICLQVIMPLVILMASCTARKQPAHITQYTDLAHITGIAIVDDICYCSTKGGLIKWNIPAGEYSIFTTADGLPSNILLDVIVKGNDEIWVASVYGVGFFDGSSWKRYGVENGLPSNEVNSLSLDQEGNLWAATIEGGAKFERGRFSALDGVGAPVGFNVQCIYFDKGENMWVGTTDKGVYMKTEDGWVQSGSKDGLMTDASSTIIQSWDNSIWTASWAGISRWDGFGWSGFKPMDRLGTYKARQLKSTRDHLWFFTANGVHASKGSDWLHYTEDDGLVSNDVNCGYVVSDDLIYVGTSYGLSVIKNGEIENFVIPNKPFGHNCTSVTIDDCNRVWVGTWETGLNLYSAGYWSKITGKEPGMLSTVRSILFGPENKITFHTTNGIVVKNENDWTVYTRQDGITSDDIRCGVYDNQGKYWVGTATGISCLDNGIWKRYRAVHGLPSEDIWSCALDKNGTVWFGTTSGILSVEGDTISDRSPEIDIDSLDVRSILSIDDSVYFGLESGKLVVFEDGEWNVYGNNFLETVSGIYSIAAEPSGALWFGTNGDGVIRLEDSKTQKYTVKDGLPSNYVRSVAYSEGVLWAACFGGVGTIELIEQ
ncbi:MAG: hypothetical protein JXB48_14245 [Candidatus Latescibacteria bacterium]|nr:hypothetical protein [Candidatus Latescibacterota bacterium]